MTLIRKVFPILINFLMELMVKEIFTDGGVLVFQPVGSITSSPLQPSKCKVFQSLENAKYEVGRYDGASDTAKTRK